MSKGNRLHAWKITETKLDKNRLAHGRDIFSIGNSRMRQSGYFEEFYSGQLGKSLDPLHWIGINIKIDGEVLDLNHCKIRHFERHLNMEQAYVERRFEAVLVSGKIVKVYSQRFCSMDQEAIGAIRYRLQAINFSGVIRIEPYLGLHANAAANWEGRQEQVDQRSGILLLENKETGRQICAGMQFSLQVNEEIHDAPAQLI